MIVTADGYLNFDTKINTSGFELGLKNITGSLDKLKSGLLKLGGIAASAFAVSNIKSFADECKSLWNVQLEAETRLGAILKGNLGATDEQVQSLKDYASELQNIGVIGDEVQLSGLQELSTYVENADNLKPMMSVLTDMLAQQYGLNATAEEAVTISTMLGKVLGGQTSALSRYGYFFDEAQEQLLKFGTEEERVATLAEVVSASVGGVNEAFAQTNAGKMQQLSNTMGDIKEQFGDAVTQIEVIFLPALTKVAEYLAEIATLAQSTAKSLASAFGIKSAKNGYGAEISENLDSAVESQESLTQAVEETEKAQKGSLAAFDEINTISSEKNDESDEISENTVSTPTISPVIDESPVEEAVDDFAKKIQDLLSPIKKAWENNSAELIANAEYAANSVKSLFSGIGESISNVWKNGTGEEFIGNIIRLFGDVLGIIGDVSNALKNAWDDDGCGEKLIQSYFDRWNAFLELIHVVSETFRNAWNDGTGEEICGNILEIWTNINNTVTNLRTNFAETWGENDVGQRISQGILDIFETISEIASGISFSVSEWAGNVDFSPFLESVDSLLTSLEPFTESIGEGLEDFLNEVLLPLADWTIEDLIPTFLESLSDAIDGVKAAWDTAYPVVKEKLWDKFLKPIANFTADMAIKAIELLGKAIKKIGESITENQVAALIDFAEGIGALILVAKGYTFLQSLSTALSGILTALAGLGSAATLSLSTVFAGISAFIAGFSLTTAFLDAFGLTEVLEKIGENIYDFLHITLPKVFNGIKEWLGGFLTSIFESDWVGVVEIFDNIPQDIENFVTEIWSGIKNLLQPLADWWEERFQKVYDTITQVFEKLFDWLGEKWNKIKLIYSEVGDFFKEKFQIARDNITLIFKGLGAWFGNRCNDVKLALSAIDDWFKEKFQTAWDNITAIFSGFSDWFSEKWENIKFVFSVTGDFFREKFQSAWDNIKSIFANPAEFFNEVWDGIKGCFSHVSDWFRDTFSEAWQTVKNVFSSGGEIFNGIQDGIFENFKNVVNSLIDGINTLIRNPFEAINGALDGIRSIEFAGALPFEWLPSISIPEIPKLAQGTVVPANYGEFMAILGDNRHETEIVSPLSTIEKALKKAAEISLKKSF